MEAEEVNTNIEDINLHKPSEEVKRKFSFFRIGDIERDFWPHDSICRTVKYTPAIIAEYGSKSNEIIFNIASSGFMDPYTSCFSFRVKNSGTQKIFIDSSMHSIINEIQVFSNGTLIERYKEYNLLHKLTGLLSLSLEERIKRRKDEGFSIDPDRNTDTVIPQSTITAFTSSSQISNDNWRDFEYDFLSGRITSKTAETILANIKNDNRIPKETHDYLKGLLKTQDERDTQPYGISPKENQFNEDFYGEREFNLKFESVFFGNRITKKNWRLIPMSNIKLQIKVILSQEYGYTENHEPIKTLRIINPSFKFKEYSFSPEWTTEFTNQLRSSKMLCDFISYDIVLKKWIEDTKMAMSIINLKIEESKTRVRGIYIFFRLNDDINQIKFKKPFQLYNPGFTKIQLQNDGSAWPADDYFNDFEALSYSGNKKLLKRLEKNTFGFEKANDLNGKHKLLLTKQNLTHVAPSKDVENFPLACILFDTVPYGDVEDVTGGITELKQGANYIISMKRTDVAQAKSEILINDSQLNFKNVQLTVYLLVESNVKALLDINGNVSYY